MSDHGVAPDGGGPGVLGVLGGLVPLEGGWSGETFLADLTALGGERTVVRVYAARGRGPEAPEVDAAVLRLVRGLVPVPEVLEVRRGRGAGGDDAGGAPGLLVTSWLPGERLDLVLPRLDDAGLAAVGSQVGGVAAALAAMPQLRPGWFTDGELRVQPWQPDLPAYVEEVRPHLLGPVGWTAAVLAGLVAVAEEAQDLLDGLGRASLVHGDLNPKNVLVDPESLVLTGVVDWEFAHAGLPGADLGNLLRSDREPAWVEGCLAAWCGRHGGTPDEALALARAADLFALVDLATRAGDTPPQDRARAQLRAVAAGRDLHALPGWTRPAGRR